jgi:DNA-binding response OmpR family regulator
MCGTTRHTITISLPGLVIDLLDRHVVIGGHHVHLSGIEYDLLVYMARHPDRVVTKQEAFRHVWGYRTLPRTTRTVEVHVARLRKRIFAATGQANYLSTVRGVGWRLRDSGTV